MATLLMANQCVTRLICDDSCDAAAAVPSGAASAHQKKKGRK
jgi:hypothetical protein